MNAKWSFDKILQSIPPDGYVIKLGNMWVVSGECPKVVWGAAQAIVNKRNSRRK